MMFVCYFTYSNGKTEILRLWLTDPPSYLGLSDSVWLIPGTYCDS